MISKQGMELAVSTLVIITISILVMLGLVFMLTGGFSRFTSATKPFTDTTTLSAVRESCHLACTTEDYQTFCCHKYDIEKEKVLCSDTRLDVSCASASCSQVACSR